jgi:dihydrolipoamide dehydrogenase
VLMATGREAVVPEGIAALGLPAGRIGVDDRLRTTLAHVHAPGDVNGRSMLFHSAVCQSLIAAEDILSDGRGTVRMNFASVPFTVFTEPEVAWVGLTEAEAARQNIATAASTYDLRTDSRAQIFDEMAGFLKLVFTTRTGSLIGAQIAGLDAAQVIAPLALAVHAGTTAAALSFMAFPHPMVSEGINKAARAVRL